MENGRQIVDLDQEGRLIDAPMVPVQRVATKYTTAMAVQAPRVLAAVERRALEEAALLGADAYYAWGNGKDRVEGPSKDLAMALVRCYGNCAVDLGEIQETRDAWIFTATFVDLETGFTLARQFRQAKGWQVYGRFDEARKDDIRFQIGQSKAVRNVILNAVPGWLVKRALDKAKGGVREKIEQAVGQFGMEKVVAKALDTLAKFDKTANAGTVPTNDGLLGNYVQAIARLITWPNESGVDTTRNGVLTGQQAPDASGVFFSTHAGRQEWADMRVSAGAHMLVLRQHSASQWWAIDDLSAQIGPAGNRRTQ